MMAVVVAVRNAPGQLFQALPEERRLGEDRQSAGAVGPPPAGLSGIRSSCHRWHTEQLVNRSTSISVALHQLFSFRELLLGRRARSMLKMSLWSRRWRSGCRWQSRHHSMVIGSSFHVSGIWSTRPWHDTQPTPF